ARSAARLAAGSGTVPDVMLASSFDSLEQAAIPARHMSEMAFLIFAVLYMVGVSCTLNSGKICKMCAMRTGAEHSRTCCLGRPNGNAPCTQTARPDAYPSPGCPLLVPGPNPPAGSAEPENELPGACCPPRLP